MTEGHFDQPTRSSLLLLHFKTVSINLMLDSCPKMISMLDIYLPFQGVVSKGNHVV